MPPDNHGTAPIPALLDSIQEASPEDQLSIAQWTMMVMVIVILLNALPIANGCRNILRESALCKQVSNVIANVDRLLLNSKRAVSTPLAPDKQHSNPVIAAEPSMLVASQVLAPDKQHSNPVIAAEPSMLVASQVLAPDKQHSNPVIAAEPSQSRQTQS